MSLTTLCTSCMVIRRPSIPRACFPIVYNPVKVVSCTLDPAAYPTLLKITVYWTRTACGGQTNIIHSHATSNETTKGTFKYYLQDGKSVISINIISKLL